MIELHGITQNELSTRIGKSQSTISNKMRILKLEDHILDTFKQSKLTERHARSLLRLGDIELQETVLKRVIDHSLNVKETEKIVESKLHQYKKKNQKSTFKVNYRIYHNTIKKAFKMVKDLSADTTMETNETDDVLEIIIKIPKENWDISREISFFFTIIYPEVSVKWEIDIKGGNVLGKVISIFNQKGGVGKTTTNVNLSACLAKRGKKVLIIDNDPQGNSTSGVGVDKSKVEYSLYDVLVDEINPKDAIVSTPFKNLYVLPSNVDLAGAEIELSNLEKREFRLKHAIDQLRDDYDFIFMDCPPSLGLLTINSLIAADSILIPIQCEYYALEGVSSLLNTYQLVKKSLNKDLEIQGVVLSMYDGRTNLSLQVLEEVKAHFGEKVYESVIPRNVRLAEAPSYGMPIIHYDPRSKGAYAFKKLARELVAQEE